MVWCVPKSIIQVSHLCSQGWKRKSKQNNSCNFMSLHNTDNTKDRFPSCAGGTVVTLHCDTQANLEGTRPLSHPTQKRYGTIICKNHHINKCDRQKNKLFFGQPCSVPPIPALMRLTVAVAVVSSLSYGHNHLQCIVCRRRLFSSPL